MNLPTVGHIRMKLKPLTGRHLCNRQPVGRLGLGCGRRIGVAHRRMSFLPRLDVDVMVGPLGMVGEITHCFEHLAGW